MKKKSKKKTNQGSNEDIETIIMRSVAEARWANYYELKH